MLLGCVGLPSDGQASFAFGVGSVTRPEADGLNGEEGIICASGGAGLLLGICRRAQEQRREETLHVDRDFHCGAIISGRGEKIVCSGRIKVERCRLIS